MNIREYIDQLKCPEIRTRAYRACSEQDVDLNENKENLMDALNCFSWSSTKEKGGFWMLINDDSEKGAKNVKLFDDYKHMVTEEEQGPVDDSDRDKTRREYIEMIEDEEIKARLYRAHKEQDKEQGLDNQIRRFGYVLDDIEWGKTQEGNTFWDKIDDHAVLEDDPDDINSFNHYKDYIKDEEVKERIANKNQISININTDSSMSLTIEEAKRHPMFPMLAAVMGDQKAAMAVKQATDEQEKKNQATTEFSKTEKRIIVPISMNKIQASKELKRQWEDEETKINVDRQFNTWNWKDVLVATKKAAERHFGWIQGKEGMFGQKPREIDVVVDIKDGKKITETCFYGKFTASVWEDGVVDVGPGYLTAEVKKRYAPEVREFFNLVQDILDKESIFRAKAITVNKKEDPWGEVSLDFEIFEMKTSDRIVLNSDIKGVIKNFVIDDLGEEGKRCYLFSGSYGNGKTEVAMQIGESGIKKKMAFFYCKDADVFDLLLKQALNYSPSLVFLEDLDEIGAGSQRDAAMNRILNTLDGVQTKGNDLTVIFTTNHEKRINKALRRPGRIDLVVNFTNPNKDSVAKIYKIFLKDLEGADKLDYAKLAQNTPDCPGAVIAEIAKRAVKLCKKKGVATDELVMAASDSMKHHLNLMDEGIEEPRNGTMKIEVSGASIKTSKNGEANLEEAGELVNVN